MFLHLYLNKLDNSSQFKTTLFTEITLLKAGLSIKRRVIYFNYHIKTFKKIEQFFDQFFLTGLLIILI